jgi:ATP-dependent RNA helicase RhlE
MTFDALFLSKPLLKALQEEGYTQPTPIQQQAIPPILDGQDLLGCAQTGTGKTAAFALPILQRLDEAYRNGLPRGLRCLILTPTRELAIQIGESFQAYGRHLRIRSTVIFGGVGQTPQVDALKRGVDILIATPGRMLDLIGQGYLKLDSLKIFVLDEADRMLDMGFIHDIRKVIKLLPEQRQSLFFSATMPADILELSRDILHQPAEVTVTPVSSTVEIIDQYVYLVDKANKVKLLIHVLQTNDAPGVLVFTRTKYGADKLAKVLSQNGISADAIHGDKAQNARQRALSQFKNGQIRVLVATDIASRGIDIDALEFVVNFEIPNIPETYVHRIGRTGRAGSEGTAISFCDHVEAPFLYDIEKLIGKFISIMQEHPYPMEEEMPARKQAHAPKSAPKPSAPLGHRRPRHQGARHNKSSSKMK